MLSKKHLLLPTLFILVSGFFILSSPLTANAGDVASSCCSSHVGPGCNDVVCEDAVCAIDGYCCDVEWDDQCADEAIDLCEVCRILPIQRNVPTMSEWGLIAFAGILGLVGFFYIYTRKKRAIS